MQRALGAEAVPTYQYHFKHVLSFDCWGPDYTFCQGKCCHGSELPFVFNVFEGNGFSYSPTADEKQLATDMSNAWANFMMSPTAAPNGDRAVMETFPLYNADTVPLVVLDQPDYSEVNDPRATYCDMWDKLGYFY